MSVSTQLSMVTNVSPHVGKYGEYVTVTFKSDDDKTYKTDLSIYGLCDLINRGYATYDDEYVTEVK